MECRTKPVTLVICALLAAVGCETAGTSRGQPEAVRGGPFLVVTRCGFQGSGGWRHIDVASFAVGFPRPAEARECKELLDDLQGLLAGAAPVPALAAPMVDRSRAIRSYELSDLRHGEEAPEIEVLDPGSGAELEVVARRAGVEVRVTRALPEVSFVLRQAALAALGRSMAQDDFPARRALPWHGAALARFLERGALVYPPDWKETPAAQERRIVAAVLRELRRLDDAEGATALAAALVPALDILTDADLAALRADGRPTSLVLPLTREGRGGKREALADIVTLGMEQGGDVSPFAAALRRLIPASENPLLHQKCPAGTREGDLCFLDECGRRLGALAFTPESGWRLPESRSEASSSR